MILNTKTRMIITIKKETDSGIRALAKISGKTPSEYVDDILTNHIKRNKKKLENTTEE